MEQGVPLGYGRHHEREDAIARPGRRGRRARRRREGSCPHGPHPFGRPGLGPGPHGRVVDRRALPGRARREGPRPLEPRRQQRHLRAGRPPGAVQRRGPGGRAPDGALHEGHDVLQAADGPRRRRRARRGDALLHGPPRQDDAGGSGGLLGPGRPRLLALHRGDGGHRRDEGRDVPGADDGLHPRAGARSRRPARPAPRRVLGRPGHRGPEDPGRLPRDDEPVPRHPQALRGRHGAREVGHARRADGAGGPALRGHGALDGHRHERDGADAAARRRARGPDLRDPRRPHGHRGLARHAAGRLDLLEEYRTQLPQHGGPSISHDDALLAYRQQAFWAYTAWAFTIGRASYQPEMQPVPTCLAIIRRTAIAIEELDSFAAVGV
jgi:hypothetical protein